MGKASKSGGKFDHNADHYPSATDALTLIRDKADLPEGAIERVEVTFLASGECTYRIWPARAEEPIGGYLTDFVPN